jgi:hypothetical protein
MLIVETGGRTRFGATAASLAANSPPTALEQGVRRLGLLILRLTLFLTLFVLLAHLAAHRPAVESFLFAVALAVGLTPELPPMVMTVTLARGAKRKASRKVIVWNGISAARRCRCCLSRRDGSPAVAIIAAHRGHPWRDRSCGPGGRLRTLLGSVHFSVVLLRGDRECCHPMPFRVVAPQQSAECGGLTKVS